MRTKRGFTLIELLVVIAIIAILAAILFPVFAQARERGRTASCLSNVGQIAKAIRMYADDFNGRYMYNADVEDKNDHGGDYLNAPYPWIALEKYTSGKDVWRCPSDQGVRFNRAGPISAITGITVKKLADIYKKYPNNPLTANAWGSYITVVSAGWNTYPAVDVPDPVVLDAVPYPSMAVAVMDPWQSGGEGPNSKNGQWHLRKWPEFSYNVAFFDGHAKNHSKTEINNFVRPDTGIKVAWYDYFWYGRDSEGKRL